MFSGGFGQDGPYRGYPAFDDIIQAYSGLAAIKSIQTGQPELVPMVVCDTISGLNLGQALLAGLLRQKMCNEGVCIEVPMYEVMVSAVMNQHLSGEAFVSAEGELRCKRVMDPSRRPCKTKDGYIVHGIYKVENWRNFMQAIGREDILHRGMLKDRHTGTANIGNLYDLTLKEIMPTRATAEWVERFDKLDNPYGKVQTLRTCLATDICTKLVCSKSTNNQPRAVYAKCAAGDRVWSRT